MLRLVSVLIAGWLTMGGWAVVTVKDLPEYVVAGQRYTLEFQVRQHGRTLMNNVQPQLLVATSQQSTNAATLAPTRSDDGTYRVTFAAPQTDRVYLTVVSGCGGRSLGLTALDSSGLEAAAEPVDALGRCAVREGFRVNCARGSALEPIVADRGGGSNALFDIPRLEHAFARHEASPNAGVAIGLQLAAHGAGVRRAEVVAEQRLYVMPDLVGEHVGLREVARGAEPATQLVIESEIDVHLVIARAVEGSTRLLRKSARRLHRVAE